MGDKQCYLTGRYLFIYDQIAIIVMMKDKPCENMEKDHFTVEGESGPPLWKITWRLLGTF